RPPTPPRHPRLQPDQQNLDMIVNGSELSRYAQLPQDHPDEPEPLVQAGKQHPCPNEPKGCFLERGAVIERGCGVLPGVSLPSGDHLPLRVAVLPLPAELPEVEEMMLARGVVVSHETIRQWCAKFGAAYAAGLRRRRARAGDSGRCGWPSRRSTRPARARSCKITVGLSVPMMCPMNLMARLMSGFHCRRVGAWAPARRCARAPLSSRSERVG
ncbi:MAG: putative transposase, partial [Pseudonocardiales bacterium]|nr:putative transposase [Pseudonocardiales bacterium]